MSDKKSPLAELRRLRDEIRVKLDLAGKETKSWWASLEPQLSSVEDKLKEGGGKVAGVSRTVGEELAGAFRRIRDRVGQGDAAPAPGNGDGNGDEPTDAELVDDDPKK